MASANDKIPEMTSWISRRMDSEEPLKVSELVGFLPLAAILTLLFISVAAVFNLIYRLLFARRVTAVGSKTTSNEKSLADLEELQRKLEALETLLNSPSRQTAGQDLSVGHRLEILFTKVGLLEGAHTQAIIDQGRLDRLESSISNISRDRHPDLSASSSPHGGPPPPPPPPPPLQKIEPVVIVPTTKKPKIEPEGPVTLGASMSDVLLEMSKKQRKIVQMISSPRSKYLESRVNTTKIPQRESALRIPIRSDSDDETSQDVADKKPKSPSERHGVKRRSSSTTREPEVREVAAGKPVPDLRKFVTPRVEKGRGRP
ncbi:uncharacterized protein BJ171DRAFT_241768 [Polychytrium aggregatum]|uniref:uncharacterized protein n=1 Tax=Polychytrium aggregatum TaxID=110093 RepID=UPI0022FE877C|nr:uncharacterized protein BJ171DRAFT_241768 [Polychytrium aggregatum]KAI9197076.1 hypothetical protein BJ171DRAFT_241768 [Polychytrium aggregatum]